MKHPETKKKDMVLDRLNFRIKKDQRYLDYLVMHRDKCIPRKIKTYRTELKELRELRRKRLEDLEEE